MTDSAIDPPIDYYVPFWILLEYLDQGYQDPWVKVSIIRKFEKFASAPSGPVQVECCDLMINDKPHLVAHSIPFEYLIDVDDLDKWSRKIAGWFTDYKVANS
tara:strand:- start:4514 stop:4819 length:306 start_codon:yes stop_codon:yes gene_type:complete